MGYQNENRGLHPAAIPPEDIENPEEYQKIINRLGRNPLVRASRTEIFLEKLSDYSRFSPRPDFSLFEFYNRTGIQLEELLLGRFKNRYPVSRTEILEPKFSEPKFPSRRIKFSEP